MCCCAPFFNSCRLFVYLITAVCLQELRFFRSLTHIVLFAASDKPDLGLEELQQLNVKERFQVFEHHEDETQTKEMLGTVSVKRSPSILSKLAR